MNNKTTAKDFFLHVAVIALLYAGAIALINLLFRIINVAFPQVMNYGYYNSSSSIALPVATLIVVFPLFLFISNLLRKDYESEPEKKDYAVRRWLIYITLFVAGAVMAGDLVTLIYFFLDGRELTLGFLFKALVVLVVAGSIFGYYVDDLKGRLVGSRRTFWRIIASILVLGSIILGFSVIGTPATQRMIRYDSQKVTDLQSVQWQIINYWQQKGSLPETLANLEDPIAGFTAPVDSQTGASYEYEKTGNLSFRLCAEFNRMWESTSDGRGRIYTEPLSPSGQNWNHPAGRHCFERTVDTDLYPVKPR